METLINIAVAVLRLVPLVILFYIPALIGVVIWSERTRAYRLKTGLWFALGFGIIVAIRLVFTSSSPLQALSTVGVSLIQIAAALALAAFTVYKLAD